MKNKTKIVLLLSGLIILFVIKISDFSFEKTSSVISIISTNTTGSKDTSKIAKTFDRPYHLAFHGLNVNRGKTNTSDFIIDVYVEEKTSLGFLRFLPIYKPIKINSSISYKWNNPLRSKLAHVSEETGSFSITGNNNLFGTSSTERAEKKTINLIQENIAKKIEADIQMILNHQIKNKS